MASLATGDDAIEFAESIGYRLLDWQCWLIRLLLAERVDGSPAAPQSVIIIPRQNGKNVVLEVVELYGLYVQSLQHQIHSAHEAPTAGLHMAELKGRIMSDPDLDAITDIFESNGKERIVNRETGGTIWFRTRTKAAKRGSAPQRVVFDEALFVTDKHLAALVPAMAAQSMDAETLPQMIFTSSAPIEESEVLHRLRQMCLDGRSDRTLFVEWGTDADADVTDRDVWYATNPSLGLLISEGFVYDTEFAVMSQEDFATERLGVPKALEEQARIVPDDLWQAMYEKGSDIASNYQIALEVSADRDYAAFGAAGRRADGLIHVETIHWQAGTGWVLARAVKLWTDHKVPIRIQLGSPAASFIKKLRQAKVGVIEVPPGEVAQATGQFIDDAKNGDLRHVGQGSLDQAVMGAVLRSAGDAQMWGRRTSKVDICALVAVTIALGGVPDAGAAAPLGAWK